MLSYKARLIKLAFLKTSASSYLSAWAQPHHFLSHSATHAHAVLFSTLICWSRMEARPVSTGAWRSPECRESPRMTITSAHTLRRSFLPRFAFLVPICASSLFYSVLLIPSPLPCLICACCNFCKQSSSHWKRAEEGGREVGKWPNCEFYFIFWIIYFLSYVFPRRAVMTVKPQNVLIALSHYDV